MPKGRFGNSDYEKTYDTTYGAFTLRRPSVLLRSEMHKEYAREAAGLNMDAIGQFYLFLVSQAVAYARSDEQIRRSAWDETPSGWPENFSMKQAYDEEFLPDLIRRHNEWIESFRKPQQPDADQEGSAGRSAESVLRDSPEVQLRADGPKGNDADGSGDHS